MNTAGNAGGGGRDPFAICRDMVRGHDRARFLTTLFAPAGARRGLWALYAFNHEIARVADTVSETMVGRIRLAWWREAVEDLPHGRVRDNAVCQALAASGLEGGALVPLVDAREAALDSGPPVSLADLEARARDSEGALARLAWKILGAPDDGLETAAWVGIAWALIGGLCAAGFRAKRDRHDFPLDLCAAAGLKGADIAKARAGAQLAGVAAAIAARAEHYLRGQSKYAGKAAAVLLLKGLARNRLARLAEADFNPFDPDFATGGAHVGPGAQLKMLIRVMTGRI